MTDLPSDNRRPFTEAELQTLPLQALLVRGGFVGIDQLSELLRENVSTGRSVEDIAVSRGLVSAEVVTELRAARAAAGGVEDTRAAPAPKNGRESVGVFLTIDDGERLFVERCDSRDAAERRAQEIVATILRPEPGVWPRFGNRLVRPEAIAAVEVAARD